MNPLPDFRDLLKRELESRMTRNPGYSLRAFARDLGIQAARLSSILSGKKGLSRESATDIADQLGLSEREKSLFVSQVETRHSRSRSARAIATQRLKTQYEKLPAKHLSIDAFHVIADWYHFAILELLKWNSAKHDPKWIARQLGIDPLQARQALERLVRLGILTLNSKGDGKPAYVASPETVLAPDGVPSDAIKKFHEQILRRAIDALYLQKIEDRDFCSQVSSIRSRDLPEIRRETRDFFDRIEAKFANAPDGDRVVCISNQIFNLSMIPKESP